MADPMSRLLLVDDEDAIRFAVRDFLESRGHQVEEAITAAEAEKAFQSGAPDAVILDYRLPDGTALDLLPKLQALDASVPVLVLTAHASIDLAVQAVKLGAEQFLAKPVELPALELVVDRMLEHQRNRRVRQARRTQNARDVVDPFVGTSEAIRSLAKRAQRLLESASPIMILGETGSGKGVLARWLHANGPRADEPFLDLNCAGLSRELLESELFGFERGAFTGAVAAKPGLLEVAHRGVAFLDEIGDLDIQLQPKLLKVLDEKRFRRLGEVRDRLIDVQLVVATHRDLAAAVQDGSFRSDLYFRVSTLPLRMPALRERPEDILLLARWLLGRCATEQGRRDLRLSPSAERALQEYSWPGNVREMRNVLERAALMSTRDELQAEDFQFEATAMSRAPQPTGALTLAEVERQHIESVLKEAGGRVPEAASRLGLARSTLYEKLRRLGLTPGKG
jgi:DNA-binding NtrC family response regulator